MLSGMFAESPFIYYIKLTWRLFTEVKDFSPVVWIWSVCVFVALITSILFKHSQRPLPICRTCASNLKISPSNLSHSAMLNTWSENFASQPKERQRLREERHRAEKGNSPVAVALDFGSNLEDEDEDKDDDEESSSEAEFSELSSVMSGHLIHPVHTLLPQPVPRTFSQDIRFQDPFVKLGVTAPNHVTTKMSPSTNAVGYLDYSNWFEKKETPTAEEKKDPPGVVVPPPVWSRWRKDGISSIFAVVPDKVAPLVPALTDASLWRDSTSAVGKRRNLDISADEVSAAELSGTSGTQTCPDIPSPSKKRRYTASPDTRVVQGETGTLATSRHEQLIAQEMRTFRLPANKRTAWRLGSGSYALVTRMPGKFEKDMVAKVFDPIPQVEGTQAGVSPFGLTEFVLANRMKQESTSVYLYGMHSKFNPTVNLTTSTLFYNRMDGDLHGWMLQSKPSWQTHFETWEHNAVQMIAAVARAHSRNVIHLDIRLDNFLYKNTKTMGTQVFLHDYGMARWHPYQSSRVNWPHASDQKYVVNTQYRGPELLRHEARLAVMTRRKAMLAEADLLLRGRVPPTPLSSVTDRLTDVAWGDEEDAHEDDCSLDVPVDEVEDMMNFFCELDNNANPERKVLPPPPYPLDVESLIEQVVRDEETENLSDDDGQDEGRIPEREPCYISSRIVHGFATDYYQLGVSLLLALVGGFSDSGPSEAAQATANRSVDVNRVFTASYKRPALRQLEYLTLLFGRQEVLGLREPETGPVGDDETSAGLLLFLPPSLSRAGQDFFRAILHPDPKRRPQSPQELWNLPFVKQLASKSNFTELGEVTFLPDQTSGPKACAQLIASLPVAPWPTNPLTQRSKPRDYALLLRLCLAFGAPIRVFCAAVRLLVNYAVDWLSGRPAWITHGTRSEQFLLASLACFVVAMKGGSGGYGDTAATSEIVAVATADMRRRKKSNKFHPTDVTLDAFASDRIVPLEVSISNNYGHLISYPTCVDYATEERLSGSNSTRRKLIHAVVGWQLNNLDSDPMDFQHLTTREYGTWTKQGLLVFRDAEVPVSRTMLMSL